MQDFEKLGLFYLGRRAQERDLVLYESRDLVTHAVCVGMTGSGKTGLCLSLIEEAALDGVPVIAIDPKGDLGNLLLTFPKLSADDFRPWVDEDEARRRGVDVTAFAASEAEKWRAGLADWGQDGARIGRLREAADFAIYTPGSRAGIPVSILSSFAAPPASARDGEALADRAGTTATSVLSLAGVEATPRSREHTLLATLFSEAWSNGRSLDLPALIQQVQKPPFEKIGVVDLEAFFPSKDRFALAMQINGLLAAPGFEQWLEGEPLDPASLLHTSTGKPRVSIFSIAHLGDAERMFFVSLLLNQIVAWMRSQSGTSSLRAIVYMDEILGYFPPVANPPSKAPLLTLLKQARAFGVGVVLATQNPMDLDYKGLGNTGTWFLGRLQTDRDKARLIEGLESASGAMDRATADRLLSNLEKRVFLLHNVHAPAPVVFQTRWTMSYLAGPLSREQIRKLNESRTPSPDSPRVGAGGSEAAVRGSQLAGTDLQPRAGEPRTGEPRTANRELRAADPPIVPPGVRQYFLPAGSGGAPHYTPVVLGAARVGFGDAKLGIDESRDVLYAAPLGSGAIAVDWSAATRLDVGAAELEGSPAGGGTFAEVPAVGLQAKSYAAWEKEFGKWLLQSEKLEILRQRDLKLTSAPGESERDFRVRVQEAQRAARDAAVDAIRKKYEPKQAQLAEKLRRADAAVQRESSQATQSKIQTGLSVGAAILGTLLGRKTISAATLGRATTAARGMGRSMKESEDIQRASEQVEKIRADEQKLQDQVAEETRVISETFASPPDVERLGLSPKRGQVSVQLVGLGWMPAGD
jgi:hypothetical protein